MSSTASACISRARSRGLIRFSSASSNTSRSFPEAASVCWNP
jgi:hypothetical protein